MAASHSNPETHSRPVVGDAPCIAVVVPCFNEEEVLPATLERFSAVLADMKARGQISPDSFILFVDDGSTDATWRIITDAHTADPLVKGISLAHNRGHQRALLAGLLAVASSCDAAISIDADLQDPPETMSGMVERFRDGAEIVYGVRVSRRCDTWFKRTTAHAFYRLQSSMGLETVYDHADYRLMSSRAIAMLGEYGEANLYIRGIVPQIGLPSAKVPYSRAPRAAGRSKYPLGKMMSLSVEGITSFSDRPLRIIFFVGLALLLLDIGMGLYVFSAYFGDDAIPGWTSLMLSTWFLGSLVLMALGVVGEYVGKIFMEVKHRPRFAVKETLM